MVSTKQIADGLIRFIDEEMLKSHDFASGTRFVVTLAKNAIKLNPEIIDTLMSNPLVAMFVPCEDGQYDVRKLAGVLKETFAEAGNFKLSLPKIPLLLPAGEEMSFNDGDVQKLVMYMEEA
jgi:hypothetical protein